MYGSNSKVSFIPKGPLVRDESFLERKRPQSAIGFLAVLAFMATIGSYVGLYFYNISLLAEISTRTEAIKTAQSRFSGSTEVAQAKVFRARAELAKELLEAHVIVSPVFAFLSDNTLESVMYEKFSFTRKEDEFTLDLSGAAPTYASLAYQADKLRERTKKELMSFSIDNVTLNKFGNVNFALKMVFSPNYLSYMTGYSTRESTLPVMPRVSTSITPDVGTTTKSTTFSTADAVSPSATSSSFATTTIIPLVAETKLSATTSSGWNAVQPVVGTTTKSVVPTKDINGGWWSWFKFW